MINDWDMARPSTEVLCRGRSETIGPCMEVPCKRLRRNEFASTWGPLLGVMIYDSDMVSLSVEVLCRDWSEMVSPYMEVPCKRLMRNELPLHGGLYGES